MIAKKPKDCPKKEPCDIAGSKYCQILTRQRKEGYGCCEPAPICKSCGCSGNRSCGHDPIDKENLCALGPDLLCPCCDWHGKIEFDPNACQCKDEKGQPLNRCDECPR